MRISNIFYAIGQSFRNMGKNKGYTCASIATISACLFMFGLFFSVLFNIRSIMNTAEQGVSVTVFFQEGTTEDEILQLKVAVEERPEVSRVEYVSAEQAWESFSQDYLQGYADGFTENPLANSANLEIYLSDVSKQADLVNYLEGLNQVREVNRSEMTADTLSGANTLIMYASIAIIAMLLVVSVFLISNTIAMGITTHWEEISIMKYIGATDLFVRAPYVIEGVMIGLVGTVIPLILVYWLYNKAVEVITGKFSVLMNFLQFQSVDAVFHYLLPVSLVLGVGIGFFGSIITVRKHLHV
ncbi:MAG: permease-like cell division protein FtsX [Lachnospiraceae bacterium]|nr:permease-like cell division protein FtsX [Lachnospiraceae bacterium]